MTHRILQWLLQYQFSDSYASESAWKVDFDKFCRELKAERARG